LFIYLKAIKLLISSILNNGKDAHTKWVWFGYF